MSRYPFSAIVGMADLRLALLLNAVSPEIGGVLVRGEKGTAKSTAVRALAAVLPPVDVVPGCRFSCDPARPADDCPDGPHQPGGPAGTRPTRLCELPVGATEDRLVGSLDLERALTAGVTTFEPGLLAAAHRGVLYVDEVNLLHDHLVDLLLDAAALGVAHVERDGVSVQHAARFLLVGTMNPEEGELRPQLLDRFGLTVEVTAPREPGPRAEVVRRRLAFDADPDLVAGRYARQEAELSARIATARARLAAVRLPDAMLTRIAAVCAAFDVDGLRADIVTARAAIAHAAWTGRTEVTAEDVRVAATLALPHRRRRNPFDAPGLDPERLDAALDAAAQAEAAAEAERENEPGPEPPDPDGGGGPGAGGADPAEDHRAQETSEGPDASAHADDEAGAGSSTPAPGNAPEPRPAPTSAPAAGRPPVPAGAAGAAGAARPARDPADDAGSSAGTEVVTTEVAAPAATFRARRLEVPGVGRGAPGRRSRAVTGSGAVIRSDAPAGRVRDLHLIATLLAAAPHQAGRGRQGPGLVLRRGDLREARREGREGNLVLFVVDASGSMAARARMGTVKAAVLSLLLDAYQRRDKVGMITFRGAGAELALPPTSSVDVAAARLTVLPTGGRTPLADGLLLAHRTLVRERLRDPSRRPLLVVVTDGRHTAGGAPAPAAALLARTGVAAVVVDCEAGRIRLGLAAELAGRLGALVLPLEDLGGAGLGPAVRGGAGAAAVPRGPDRPGGGSGGGSGSGGGGGGGGAGGGGGPGGGLAATVRALRDAA